MILPPLPHVEKIITLLITNNMGFLVGDIALIAAHCADDRLSKAFCNIIILICLYKLVGDAKRHKLLIYLLVLAIV